MRRRLAPLAGRAACTLMAGLLLALGATAQQAPTGGAPAPSQAGVAVQLPGRLLAQGDRVYDRKTDLTWQRCSLGQRWDAAATRCLGEPLRLGFAEALQRQQDGWRVPTLDELLSIVRPGSSPSIDTGAFPDTPPLYFWATDNRDRAVAWYVRFEDGRANHYFPPHTNRDLLRLVRSGRALPAR